MTYMWNLIIELARILIVAVNTSRRFLTLVELIADTIGGRAALLSAWIQWFGPSLVFDWLQQSFFCERSGWTDDDALAEATCQSTVIATSLATSTIRWTIHNCTLFVILDTIAVAHAGHSLWYRRRGHWNDRRWCSIHGEAPTVTHINLWVESCRGHDTASGFASNPNL